MKIEKKKIYNWSRTINYYTKIISPNNFADLKNILDNNSENLSISFLGGGCSYGDCYLNKSGIIIDLSNLNKIIDINYKEGFALVECGVRVDQLLNILLKEGFYFNSIPGANNATIGGCINSNVHGKDSFKEGVFSNNVISLKVMNSSGLIIDLNSNDDDFFLALGTYGLNFIILEAKLKIKQINTSSLMVNSEKFTNYKEMLFLFTKYENQNFDMLGAWVDHFDKDGRGIFKAARWVKNDKFSIFKKINLSIGIFKRLYIFILYPIISIFFVNRFIIKNCNKILYSLEKNNNKVLNYSDFYFPQQRFLPEESKLFSKGKINIQILIPHEKVEEILRSISILSIDYKMESWWLGIKKHKKNDFIFNFAGDGFDITLQWSKKHIEHKNFSNFYKKLIQIIIDNKCLIYLTQDILMNKEDFIQIYGDQSAFVKNKKRLDPNSVFKNSLYNRLIN